MTSVLVLTALGMEARGLARHLGLDAVRGAGAAHFRGGGLEVMAVGVGAARLAELAPAARLPSLVLSAGICGALAPHLRPGDLVVPEAVVSTAGTRYSTAALPGLTAAGTLVAMSEVLTTAEAKARAWLETGALAADMESHVVLAWARGHGRPAAVVRGVSDPASAAVPEDLVALVAEDGRMRTGRALRLALTRPGRMASALALGRDTAAALRAVARALGRIARA